MVVLKKKIVIDGQKVDVPVFQTSIKPGKNISDDVIDQIQEEEKLEQEIQEIVEKIKIIAQKYKTLEKNLDYFFETGRLLHFIDKKNYIHIRGRIWQRIAHDLEPRLLLANINTKKKGSSPQREAKRNIEDMYQMANFSRSLLHKASWNQWDEIVKFTGVQKNTKLIRAIFNECKHGTTGVSLRNKIRELRIKYF